MAHVMRHGSTVSRWHYEPMAEGEHAHRAALLLLVLGLPGAALGWQLWSRVFEGPGATLHDVHYTGWMAVVVMLPASLMVLGVAGAAVLNAARACAAHVHGSEPVFWLTGVGLLLVLAALATTSVDEVELGATSATAWLVRGVALALTATVVGAARWWAHETGS